MKTRVLRKHPKDGMIYLREAITVAFFYPTPVHESVDGLREAVQLYLKTVPPEVLTWSAIGANTEEWSPVGKATFSRCLAQLEPMRAKARPLTCFDLIDGPLGGEAPGYGIELVGSPGGDTELPDEVNFIQMSFPVERLERETVEEFVGFCRRVAELVPYVSGYVSPGLQWCMLHKHEAMAEARGLVVRHPGYDVQINDGTRLRLGKRVRGARWLTFLRSDIIATLGGEARIRGALSKAIAVEVAGDGLMIRAGEMPELGDVNQGIGVPLLREVAAVLEPVTAFHDLVLFGNFANRDEAFLERWERRFLT